MDLNDFNATLMKNSAKFLEELLEDSGLPYAKKSESSFEGFGRVGKK